MIVLTVQSFNGQASVGLTASFDELGGTIGRADTNQLVLPDPERSISRVHAQVVFRHGGYAVIDRGSNPVQVNGQPLGNGRESPLKHGDTLQIGGYAIGVTVGQQTTAKDLFADLFGDASGQPAKPPVAPQPPSPLFTQTFGPSSLPPSAPPASAPAAARPGAVPSTIPDDWDPFAPAPAPAPASAGGAPGPLDFGFGSPAPDLPISSPPGTDSLDALFGLGGSGGDPFATSPLAQPLAGPNTNADADPLRALGMEAPRVAAPVADHVSDLHTPWMAAPLQESAPPPIASPAPRALQPASPAAAGAEPAPPPGAILSWNHPTREAKVVTLPGVRRVDPPEPPAPPAPLPAPPEPMPFFTDAADPQTMIRAPSAQRAAAVPPAASFPAPARPAVPSAGGDTLVAALAEGLGMSAADLQALDAEQMRRVGALLREATRGAVELLVARAAIKREMRADVTMMAARENNPLKFSPNVEVALKHLLGPTTPGFMGPTDAMRDAFDDLRAHQLGVMAGMRAALDGVLERFDPAVLEGKISKRSGLAGLLPSGRKAQLWEQFQSLYTQLSAEAADDFQELFGKAFRKAYEAHIDQLQQGG